MKRLALGAIASACIFSGTSSFAASVGKVLFSQTGATIVDSKGVSRVAKRGDELAAGESLVLPSGAIAQVLLSDGSLVGARPGSEIKFDASSQASAGVSPPQLSLVTGSLRVIGAELMDSSKVSAVTLLSGLATLKLTAADLESAIVRPVDAKAPAGPGTVSPVSSASPITTNSSPVASASGSYNRLLIGAGSIRNGALIEPLSVRQVSYVGQSNVAPVTVTTSNPTVFAPSRVTSVVAVAPAVSATSPAALTANVPVSAAPTLAGTGAIRPATSITPSFGTAISSSTIAISPPSTSPTLTSPIVSSPVLSAPLSGVPTPSPVLAQPSVSVSPVITAVPAVLPAVSSITVQPAVIAPVLTPVRPISPVTPVVTVAPVITAPVLSTTAISTSSLISSGISITTGSSTAVKPKTACTIQTVGGRRVCI